MVTTRLQAFYNPFIGFLPQLGLAAILFYGGRQVIDGRLTIGEFSAFYAYLLMLLSPMRTLGISLGLAQRATAAGARVYQILDREPRIVSPPGAPALPPGSGHVELRGGHAAIRGRARARRCTTSTSTCRPARRSRWSAPRARARRRSCQLIPRLYDVSAGAVLVDGADVRDVDVASLRAAIAVVDDDPFLFSATVAENIAYARADATREEIELAARRAQAHDFIARLPDGYDTRVGERGLTLSGGQRQRVAIARALLADPRILILDDATSSVDASTEQEIKAALREVMAGRTTLRHRPPPVDHLAGRHDRRARGRRAWRPPAATTTLLEQSELYREIVEKGLPDQVFLTRNEPEREVAGL